MAKAKFMNGEFSAKFKGKRKFVAEQMGAIKDYAARDDMQINICPVIQERPSEKKNTEEQITPTHSISGNLEHAVVAIYDNAGIPSFMHRFRKVTNKELFGGSDKANAAFMKNTMKFTFLSMRTAKLTESLIACQCRSHGQELPMMRRRELVFQRERDGIL